MTLKSLTPWREQKVPAPRSEFGDPFLNFRSAVDRMFDDFFGSRSLAPWAGVDAITPTIDVGETDKELVVTAEIPGLQEKDFEVTLTGDVLTIKGEKNAETEDRNRNAYYLERRYGSFSRSIRLPFDVEGEGVEAKYDRGVLTVKVPKPASAQRQVRRIEVKSA